MKTILNKTSYTKNLEKNQLIVEREFAAAGDRVWDAFTKSEILDQWWAPRPWKAETKSMDFRAGGSWHYSMNGPEGEKHYALSNFKSINPKTNFETEDCFCDEAGVVNESVPKMHWSVNFEAVDKATKVRVIVTFVSAEALQQIVDMGFQEGFAGAHDNLEELLATGV